MSKNRHARRPGEILDLPKSMRLPTSSPTPPTPPPAPVEVPAPAAPMVPDVPLANEAASLEHEEHVPARPACPRCGRNDDVTLSAWENRLPDPVTINGRFFAHGLILRGCHCRGCNARFIDRQPGVPAE